MSLPKGGKGDKLGNLFETRWVLFQLLNVISEKLSFICYEPVGENEEGVDLLIGKKNGYIQFQQCKSRNGTNPHWTISHLQNKSMKLLRNAKKHILNNEFSSFGLVSPVPFDINIEDLGRIAKSCNDNKQFLEEIDNRGKNMKNIFKKFCNKLNLNPKKDDELTIIIKIILNFKYISFKDDEVDELIKIMIENIFYGNPDKIYDILYTYVSSGELFNKRVDINFISGFLNKKNIVIRNDGTKIKPIIDTINKNYERILQPINNKLISRNEIFNNINKNIKNEKSTIITGKSGCGKSLSTLSAINFCRENHISYLAINLLVDTPKDNLRNWSKKLGFENGSLVNCIDSFNHDKPFLIILDQLDVLAWANGSLIQSINICNEIISQIEVINFNREHNISLIFVCRSYDLENDPQIRELFDDKNDWEKISVDKLKYEQVKQVIGTKINYLPKKTIELLKIPSNLFIFTKLDYFSKSNPFRTSIDLINEWKKQIIEKSSTVNLNESNLKYHLENLIDFLDENTKISFTDNDFLTPSEIKYLRSTDFIKQNGRKYEFAHQSIIDGFFAKKMIDKIDDDKTPIEILGDKKNQSPDKRYQLQMALQSLLDDGLDDIFFEFGEKLFEDEKVRFYHKFVFIELLQQKNIGDENGLFNEFVTKYANSNKYKKYLVNNVFYGNNFYLDILINNNILQQWLNNEDDTNNVLNLLISVSENYSETEVNFIKKYIYSDDRYNKLIINLLPLNVINDSNEMFSLRLHYYEKHLNELKNKYFDFQSIFQYQFNRALKLICLILKNDVKYSNEFKINGKFNFNEDNSKIILKNILPLLPKFKNDKYEMDIYDWETNKKYGNQFKISIIYLLERATSYLAENSPNIFWKLYSDYFGKNYAIFNQLILVGLNHLPISESDRVIDYLSENILCNVITIQNQEISRLTLALKVVKKFLNHTNPETSKNFETSIININNNKIYSVDRLKKIHENDFDLNLKYESIQYHFLKLFSKMSTNALNLYHELEHKDISTIDSYYNIMPTTSFGVQGYNKRISLKEWGKIINGNKLENNDYELVENFEFNVKEKPIDFIDLLIKNKNNINDSIVNTLYQGIIFSENIKNIKTEQLEILFDCFSIEKHKKSFCEILSKLPNRNWSKDTVEYLNNIALEYNFEKNNGSFSKQEIYNIVVNSSSGKAILIMDKLINCNPKNFRYFKSTIIKLANSNNIFVIFSILYVLNSMIVLNIKKNLASELIANLFITRCELILFSNYRNCFHYLYNNYCDDQQKIEIINILKKGFYSSDDEIIRKTSLIIVDFHFYFKRNTFKFVFDDYSNLSPKQLNNLIKICWIYFDNDDCNIETKNMILNIIDLEIDIEQCIMNLFNKKLINLTRDSDFLKEVLKNTQSSLLIRKFVEYLKMEQTSLIDYQSLILDIASSFAKNHESNRRYFGNDIFELIVSLYDKLRNKKDSQSKVNKEKCLEIIDLIYMNQVGEYYNIGKELTNIY